MSANVSLWEQAEAMAQLNCWEDAIGHYQKLLAMHAAHPLIHERLAWLYYKCAQFEKAIAHFCQWEHLVPEHHFTLKEHFMMGLQYFLLQQWECAIFAHLAATKCKLTSLNLKTDASFPEYKPQDDLVNPFCEYLLSIGTYQLALEKYSQVQHLAQNILRLDMTNALAHKLNHDATAYFNHLWENALEFHQQGRLAEAETKYLLLLKQQPLHHEALQSLGLLRWQRGETLQAVILLRQAMKIAPDNPHYGLNLGAVLLAQGQRDEALALFHQALALKPDFSAAPNVLPQLQA